MANDFKNGVAYYVKYVVDPEKYFVGFPEGKARCLSCDACYSDSLGRPRCRLAQNRIIEQPLAYPELPEFCVLTATGEIIGTPPEKAKGAK